MAAVITDLANGTSATSTATVVTGATVTATTADADFLVVFVAADNQGASGVASLTTVADSGGTNVYTNQAKCTYSPGSAAGDGATVAIYTCPVTANITSGTITANFSPNTTTKAMQVYRVRPAAGETISIISVDTTGLGGNRSSQAATAVSVTSGDIIFGCCAAETDDGLNLDIDTTNGSWITTVLTRLADAGQDAAAMTLGSQVKTTTGTGSQTYNPSITGATARDGIATTIVLRSATAAKSLVADVGSYGLTGTDATTRRNLPMVADPGDYALTGTDARPFYGYALDAKTPASYALTGTDTPTTHQWKVDATTPASYALTGTDANLNKGQTLVVDPGSYALTGTDVSLRRNLPMVADAGSYLLTGTDASTWVGFKIDATTAGAYLLTGTDVALTLASNKVIAAEAGTYALTGTDVTLTLFSNNKTLTVDSGSYALTGTDAATTHQWKLDATTPGSYSLAGQVADTLHKWVLDATTAGSYALTGTDAGTLHGFKLDAIVADSYALTGTDAATLHRWVLDATASGSYSLAGTDATPVIRTDKFIVAAPGDYLLVGTDVTLTKTTANAYTITADAGDYLLTGTDATLTYQPTAPEITLPTRGEWPEKGRRKPARPRKRPEVTAREDLRVALDRLYDGGEYDAPAEALEEAATKARAVVNVLTKLPDIPLIEVRAAEDLIRSIQEMLRQRVLEEEQALNDVAMEIARQHLVDTIIIADEVYRRTRQNYLLKTLLLIAE